jgi:acetylornithine deacetylase/succinyl-diaminopimelate desuccinylase-like protein
MTTLHIALDTWIDSHFASQVQFLQALVQVPTDTPPGNNTPHALKTQALLKDFGYEAKAYEVPDAMVKAAGLESITNLIVRREFSKDGKTIALNAHGDVVPPGEGWTHAPYGADIVGSLESGRMYGRATAVSKCDFSTFTFALRALEAAAKDTATPLKGAVELHFTYDEEFGGEVGPKYLLDNHFTKPDLMIAAGFSYQVITAHNGCLQLEVTVQGNMAHAAIPDSGVDAMQGANAVMTALYAENIKNRQIKSSVAGINHPYINVGMVNGGTNTNVVPGKAVLKVDRRMIPEEDPTVVEAQLRGLIEASVKNVTGNGVGCTVSIKRIVLARALKPLAGNAPLVAALQANASAVFGEPIPALGTPLYTDVRIYGEAGIPGVIYGAGPRTVLESNAKRADEHLELADLRRATKVIARTLADLLA